MMIEYDEQELKEAEALALALEGKRVAGSELPTDVLETAALLRYGSAEAELDNESQARIEHELLAELEHQPLPSAAASTRKWTFGWGLWAALSGALAAACVLLLWIAGENDGSLAGDPATLAASSPALTPILSAQTRLATSPSLENLKALDQAMESLRSSQLSETDRQLDGLFQSASNALTSGDPARALELIAPSLEPAPEPNLFVANLYLVQAQAHGELGQIEQSRGSYYQALRINEELMQKALADE